MASQIKALSSVDHSNVKIKDGSNLDLTKNQQILPLIIHEFAQAGAAMPVIFIKPTDKKVYEPACLLGLKPEENLFYKSESEWLGDYVPALISHHPFAMVQTEGEENRLQMLIDENSDRISKEGGESLFVEGKETEYLTKRKETLANYINSVQITRAFCTYLTEKDLLIEQTLTIDIAGEKVQLNGIHLVDEKKLNEMSDEDHLEMRKRGYLGPIYSHLGSLRQVNRLAKLRQEA
ncbi:MAG: SapC family protein [Psychrobium sp.]|nr:SapC family protein [Psychrobium sp.]